MKKILKISAFYFGLMIIVTALASVAFYTSYKDTAKTEKETEKKVQTIEKNVIEEVKLPEQTQEKTNKEVISVAVEEENKEKIIKPLDTEIINPYSEELKYSEYFGDWRAHTSIDFDGNGKVKCVKDGEVSKIYKHPAYGLTVEIEHGDGMKTIYASLSDTNGIEVGDKVSGGQTISSGGTSCPANKNAAVHFTAALNGKNFNPFI